jgi:hypothetical protein
VCVCVYEGLIVELVDVENAHEPVLAGQDRVLVHLVHDRLNQKVVDPIP